MVLLSVVYCSAPPVKLMVPIVPSKPMALALPKLKVPADNTVPPVYELSPVNTKVPSPVLVMPVVFVMAVAKVTVSPAAALMA